MAGLTDTRRGLAGLAWFATNALAIGAVIGSVWLYFNDGEAVKAIYWLLLSVPIGRAANAFVLNDPEGDAEYAAFLLKQQASAKK
jgi:hypothetical protein